MKAKGKHRVAGSVFGMAGVFWVASELSRLKWIALPTVRNLKGVDIIAQHSVTGKRVEIQVKTIQGQRFWLLGRKKRKEIEKDASLFFVFVRPNLQSSSKSLEGFVVPSPHVRRHAKQQPNGRFQFCWYLPKNVDVYRNGWDILG